VLLCANNTAVGGRPSAGEESARWEICQTVWDEPRPSAAVGQHKVGGGPPLNSNRGAGR